MEKLKILTLSDHPLVPSGVGIQTKTLIEGLLDTGRYKFVCLGGAIKHPNYTPQIVAPEKYGNDGWMIYPVDGHGSKEQLREFLHREKPDAVLMVTDPRFFVWVWEMEDEVRSVCPLLYWHVWDNDPSPDFNLPYYESTDHIGCISMKTWAILDDLDYKNKSYVPHALHPQLFKPLPDDDVQRFRDEHFGPHADKKFILMWNNRNARRKQTGDVIASFAKFARRVGVDDVAMLMHTAVDDPEGQNIVAVAKKFDIEKNLILSEQRLPPEAINSFYNACDATINISSNEGFGLSTLESLYAGTPIIVHMTGGLQFQIGDWWQKLKPATLRDQDRLAAAARDMHKRGQGSWWGVPVFTASRSCTGSQQIPYIYDDRVCHDDVVDGLEKLFRMGRKARKELGLMAREWASSSFPLIGMISSWDEIIRKVTEGFVPCGVRAAVI